jgi:chlorophyll synthase
MAAFLGVWVFGAALVGLALAWGYSAPPFRWKQSGWWGPAAVAVSYEGLAWFTGAAVVLQALPDWRIILLAILYSIGAHGIMTLNDFKSVEGDRVMGVRSLPVQLGAPTAARLALAIMVAPQLVVVGLWLFWGQPFAALGVALAAMLQMVFAQRLLRDPRRFAPWFNATGVLVYVAGMLISAIAVGSIVGAMA